MIAATERGLLLTTLWYIRVVDPTTLLVTGLTRDGVYLIEDGQVTAAVNNFRYNESPLDLLRRATEAGVSEKTLPREWGLGHPRRDAGAAHPRLPDVLGEPGPVVDCRRAARVLACDGWRLRFRFEKTSSPGWWRCFRGRRPRRASRR